MQLISRRKRKSKSIIVIMALIFVVSSFTSFYLFTQANNSTQTGQINQIEDMVQTDTKPEDKASTVSLSFVGDLLMHTAERKSGYIQEKNSYDFNYFFKDIKEYFADKDYIIGSFETPIIKENTDKAYSGYPAFKNPPEFIEAVKNASINALVTSNNHILDQGSKGAVETMNWLEKYSIPYTGTYKTYEESQEKPVLFLEKNNIKLALMNYTEMTNMASTSTYIVNYIDFDKIRKDIEFAKASKADMSIVWLHFGNEYQRFPSDKQKQTVETIAKMGADIIIGSHPHVIQPMEILNIDGRKVFVAYSLGNFISNQYWRYSTDGLVLNLEIEKKDDNVYFKNINYIPTAVLREYKGSEINNEKAIKTSDKDSDFITGAISRGILKGNEVKFRIVAAGEAIYDYENKIDGNIISNDYIRLKTTWNDTTGLIGESQDFKVYRDEKMQNLKLGEKLTNK